jgi:outer membrane protein assembly factor BamB
MRGSETRTTRSPRRTSRLALFAVAAVFALALTACDWPTFDRDNVHSGFVPFPDGPANPATLSPLFTVPTGAPVFSSAAIVNGVGYVGSDDGQLYAFDATGVANCGGSPVTCAPLWTGTTPTGFQLNSSPTVANGIVYIGSDDNFVYAWDAAGNTDCSGTPKTCTPLFADHTSSTQRSSPVVENGVLYIGSVHDTIEAFDANGHTNCSGAPKQCTPLWSGTAPGIIGAQNSIPAVANGLVYVGARDGNLYAFDANGTTGCSGAPKVCAPIWLATTAAGAEVASSPSVVDGVLYVGSDGGDLWAYDAAGNTNCTTGSPRVCGPLWRGEINVSVSSTPAVANGLVYVGGGDGALYAFDATGTVGCSTFPVVCQPKWASQAGSTIFLSSPAVVDGVVYIGSFHDLHAFDARTGAPISHFTTGGFILGSPAVANGKVYIGSGDGKLYALG